MPPADGFGEMIAKVTGVTEKHGGPWVTWRLSVAADWRQNFSGAPYPPWLVPLTNTEIVRVAS